MAEPQVSPHLLEAERAVLGAVLIDPARLHDVIDALEPSDFFRQGHRHVFEAALDLSRSGVVIDSLTIRDRLRERGHLDAAGGPAYVAGLMDGVPRSTNVTAYAAIVRGQALLRSLIATAQRILVDSHEADADARDVLDKAERQLLAITQRTIRGDFIDAAELVRQGAPVMQQVLDGKTNVSGIPSGFLDFDSLTRGFQRGSLTLLAGRPSMGKTAFALNAAYHAAAHGHIVGLFSLEMSRQELFMRLCASVARVDSHRLQSGYLSMTDFQSISDSWSEIAQTGLCVDDSAGVSMLDVQGKARRLQAKRGLDLVVIDYLQLMQLPKAENRNLAVADVSRALKLFARELNVPVVALSQLSRGVEARGDKKPMLSDLRDSGALEQDADLVVFLHRPEVYTPNAPGVHGLAEVIIAKHRNGPIGTVRLQWIKETTTFENRTEPSES